MQINIIYENIAAHLHMHILWLKISNRSIFETQWSRMTKVCRKMTHVILYFCNRKRKYNN